MHKKYDMERSIYHAQLWLEEGQYDLALSALQHIQTRNPEQKRQIAYLSAWCHTILEHWTEARCLLLPLYPPGDIEENWNNEKHNERERRAFYLFCLGNAAMSLKRLEEASQHYTQCLKLLSERRVNLPKVRIKALHSLGLSCMMSGFYRNYGLESPRLLKRGMKSRSLFGAWGWVGLAHFSVIRGVVAQDIVGWSHC